MAEERCICGLVVFSAEELDEYGLCFDCAGTGHEPACGCVDCAIYFEALDTGQSVTARLEVVPLSSVERRDESEFRSRRLDRAA